MLKFIIGVGMIFVTTISGYANQIHANDVLSTIPYNPHPTTDSNNLNIHSSSTTQPSTPNKHKIKKPHINHIKKTSKIKKSHRASKHKHKFRL